MILYGKELIGKKPLFELAAFISGIEIMEIDNSFYDDTNKTKEMFITNVINPFLVNATHRNKKLILYVPTNIKANFVFETINKLMDYREILNNFVFINDEKYDELSEEEAYNRLLTNISFYIDIVPKSQNYFKLFVDYPAIAKNSSIVNFHSWKNIDMTSFVNSLLKKFIWIKISKKNYPNYLLIFMNIREKYMINFTKSKN